MESPSYKFTSESVTEGHPDKLCDQVSDAVLDACLEQDPRSRVACETATKTGFVMVLGEITTNAFVNFDELVRKVVKDIGYDSSEKGFDGNTCAVMSAISSQIQDIALGVDESYEVKDGEVTDKETQRDRRRRPGDDVRLRLQRNPHPDAHAHLPGAQAHPPPGRSAQRRHPALAAPRRQKPGDRRIRTTANPCASIPCSSAPSTPPKSRMPRSARRSSNTSSTRSSRLNWWTARPKIYVNPTGRFVIGGPMGDAGVTGRKIIVDTYGGMGRHGGGAFSGKDPTKVDRSAAYAAAGWPRTWSLPGWRTAARSRWRTPSAWRTPLSINVETFGTGKIVG